MPPPVNWLPLAVIPLALSSTALAQGEKEAEHVVNIVRELYTAHENEKEAPFFQSADRSLIDRLFTEGLGNIIWAEATQSKGEVGALDSAPLFRSQDVEISDFVIGRPDFSAGPTAATVPVTFKNQVKKDMIGYEDLRETEDSQEGRIANISYSDGEDLASILGAYLDPVEMTEAKRELLFEGDYMIGNRKATVSATSGGNLYRVQFEDDSDFKLYFGETTDTHAEYTNSDEKNEKVLSKFVIKNGETSGVFTDEKGTDH